MICVQCGGEIAPGLVVCPSCHALVHADELKTLAAHAEAATTMGDSRKALEQWRRALDLLPKGSTQHVAVTDKVNKLLRRLDASEGKPTGPKPAWAKATGILGAIGLMIWKFKSIAIFILTKGKLLLFGLLNATTLFSMLLSVGVFWNYFGWPFAVGIILCIYVHEMGHIYLLHRYGIKATAPMFIPGLGAFIRQKQYPASVYEDARVGLAGPFWGMAASVVVYFIHLYTKNPFFAALASFNAYVNLFNLLPVWSLDGAHAFKALNKLQRAIIAITMLAMWRYAGDGLFLILAMVAGFRCFQKDAPEKGDTHIVVEFAVLLLGLTLLFKIPVNITP